MFTVKLPSPRVKPRIDRQNTWKYHWFRNLLQQGTNSSLQCLFGSLKPDSVEVDHQKNELYNRGCFGKSVSHQCISDNKESTENCVSSLLTKEYVILSFEEAFFLCYALGCLVVRDGPKVLNVEQLWQRLTKLNSNEDSLMTFPIMYAAYHHFRSKGWIVKPGLKFGAHFVLYKGDPRCYHATYSVKVACGSGSSAVPSWSLLAAHNRTMVNAGKRILLCYVLVPENLDVSLPTCLKQLHIQEMLVSRWVGASERQDLQKT